MLPHGGDQRRHPVVRLRRGDPLGEGARVIGQPADDEQMPHVLERAGARQLDRGVTAVVVETGLSVHVADGRLGHHDSVQAAGNIDQIAHALSVRT